MRKNVLMADAYLITRIVVGTNLHFILCFYVFIVFSLCGFELSCVLVFSFLEDSVKKVVGGRTLVYYSPPHLCRGI